MRYARVVLALLLLSAGTIAGQDRPPSPGDMPVPQVQAGPDATRLRADLDAALAGPGSRREIYDRFLPSLGAGAIIAAIEKRNPQCHSEAHDLGRAVMALRGDVGVALAECGTGCNSACMHGVLLEAFGNSTLESLVSEMNGFCAGDQVTKRYRQGSCAHGIGHALMFLTGRNAEASLNACRYFDTPALQYYCATGVFMENRLAPDPGRDEGIHGICGRITSFPAACYRYEAAAMVSRLHGVDHLAAECSALPASRRLGCFHGLGIVSSALAASDPAAFAKACSSGSASDRIMCVEGAVEKVGDYDRAAALRACGPFDGQLRSVCMEAAQNGTYSLTKPSIPLYASPEAAGEKRPLGSAEETAAHHHPIH